MPDNNNNNKNTTDIQRTIQTRDGRTVSYCYFAPAAGGGGGVGPVTTSTTSTATAIVYFYPLSGCSLVVDNLARRGGLDDYFRCGFLCVDRPGCNGTTSELPPPKAAGDADVDVSLRRIRVHIRDVFEVLERERLKKLFVLGVCLGHVYAVELCRQLIELSNNKSSGRTSSTTKKEDDTTSAMELMGLTLVSPFVGPACPHAWHISRLGSSVPSSILYAGTETMACVGDMIGRPLLRYSGTNVFKGIVSEQERQDFGWTDEDFEVGCQNALEATERTKGAKAAEARLGASKIWQSEVCDRFAEESGCGLVLQTTTTAATENKDAMTEEPATKNGTKGKPVVPIRIHACAEDKIAPLESIRWISRRCYRGSELIMEERVRSHEVMTIFGGPSRNPVILHKIARQWGLL